jgi:hypothetical protein
MEPFFYVHLAVVQIPACKLVSPDDLQDEISPGVLILESPVVRFWISVVGAPSPVRVAKVDTIAARTPLLQ